MPTQCQSQPSWRPTKVHRDLQNIRKKHKNKSSLQNSHKSSGHPGAYTKTAVPKQCLVFPKHWRSPARSPLGGNALWRGMHWKKMALKGYNSATRPCWGAVSDHCWHLVRFDVWVGLLHHGLHPSPHPINSPFPSTADPMKWGCSESTAYSHGLPPTYGWATGTWEGVICPGLERQ